MEKSLLWRTLILGNKKNYRGFTLIELAITLGIISIVAAVLFVTWPSFTVNLDAQATLLADDIRYAQNLSVSRSERYRLVKTSADSYQITNSSGVAVVLPSGGSTTTLGGGISFGAIANLPNDLIVFDSKGVPYTDTSNPGTTLSATATIVLTAGGNIKTISIAPETGWVNVQ